MRPLRAWNFRSSGFVASRKSLIFASRSHKSQSSQLGSSVLKPPTASNAVLRTIVEEVPPRMFARHKSAKVATGPFRLCRGPLSSCKYNMLQPTAGHSGRRARTASCSSVLVGSHSSSEFEKRQQIAGCGRHADVARAGRAAPLLISDQAQVGKVARASQNAFWRIVSRTIVDDDDLVYRNALRRNAVQRPFDHRWPVAHGDDRRNMHAAPPEARLVTYAAAVSENRIHYVRQGAAVTREGRIRRRDCGSDAVRAAAWRRWRPGLPARAAGRRGCELPLRCVTNPLSRFARQGRPHYRILAGFRYGVRRAGAALAACGAP